MAICNHCGEEISDPFECSRCSSKYCVDHRLPEKHDCPLFVKSEAKSPSVTKTYPNHSGGSGVEAPEPMDLEGSTVGSLSTSNESSSSRATATHSDSKESWEPVEETISETKNDFEGLSLWGRLSGLYLGTFTRTLLRALGVIAVLVAGYHLLIPLFVDVPTWTPWRQFGLIWVIGGSTTNQPMFVGDLLVIAIGAIVAWFL